MKFKPANKLVLVEVQTTTMSAGGLLHLPSAESSPTVEAKVIVSDSDLAPADSLLLLRRHAYLQCEVEGKEYSLVKEADILGVFDASSK